MHENVITPANAIGQVIIQTGLGQQSKPGHRTVVRVERIRYDLAIDDSVFTTRNLKRGRR